jgi:hypothetical protein
MESFDFNTPAQITDWPEGYVEEVRENLIEELADEVCDDDLLDHLCDHHEAMRFGQYIDLNIQQGFYVRPGNNVVDVSGSDSGYVIGALGSPSIDIDNQGNVAWYRSEVEQHYVTDGYGKLEWVLANATGPWFLTADLEEGRGEHWYWLVLRFLSRADDAAFRKAFPEAGA